MNRAFGPLPSRCGTSPTISYVYPNAGPISVGVRVTDADGGQSVATVSLRINPGAVM